MELEVTEFDPDNDEVNYPRQMRNENTNEYGGIQYNRGPQTVKDFIRRLEAFDPDSPVNNFNININGRRPETDAEWKTRVTTLKANRVKKLKELKTSLDKDAVLTEMIKLVLAGKSVEELLPAKPKAKSSTAARRR